VADDETHILSTAQGGPPATGEKSFAMVVGDADMEARVPDAALLALGLTPYRAKTLSQARAFSGTPGLDLVILPLSLDDTSLLPMLRDCGARPNRPAIVIIAQSDEINDAAEAMRAGADNCLFTPYSEALLARTIVSALKQNGRTPLTAQPEPLPRITPHPEGAEPATDLGTIEPPPPPRLFHGLIGTGAAMQAIFTQISATAASNAPIIILGEPGTGKTSLATTIHQVSERAEGPFVLLECAGQTTETLSQTLADGTGGPGLFDRAAGGTLFIDRMDELPGLAQARLFSALQDLENGSGHDDPPRLIATISGHPTTLMAAGTLRSDLYYALKVVELTLPPLRHRSDDLPALIDTHLESMAALDGRAKPTLSSAALRELQTYDWPGNLRELSNVMRGLVLTGSGARIDRNDLPSSIVTERAFARLASQYGLDASEGELAAAISPLIGKRLADIERAVIEATIAREGGSIPRAARVLDLSPSTIYRKRDAWGD